MADKTLVIKGLDHTLASLKQFDEKALREFNRVVNRVLQEAKADALSFVPFQPISGWKMLPPEHPHKDVRGGAGWPAWNPSEVRDGIKATRAEGRVSADYTTNAAALKNTSAAGVIFEHAGRITSVSKSKSGENFKKVLTERYGKARRLVWRAVWEKHLRFEREILEALEKAKRELQAALDRAA